MVKNWKSRANTLLTAVSNAIKIANVAENPTLKSTLETYYAKTHSLDFVGLFQEEQLKIVTQKLIKELEDKKLSTKLVKALKEQGVYEMVYHYPVMTAEYHSISDGQAKERLFEGQNLVNPSGPHLLRLAQKGLLFSAFASMFYLATPLIASPFLLHLALALFTASVTFLAGLCYGVINNLFASRFNLSFFLVGHLPQQRNIIISNDKNVLAIAWGVSDTLLLSAVAAASFGLSILFTGLSAPFLLPLLITATPFIALAAEGLARIKANHYQKKGANLFWLLRACLKKDSRLHAVLKKDCRLSETEIKTISNEKIIRDFSFSNKVIYRILKKLDQLEYFPEYRDLRLASLYQLEILKQTSDSKEASAKWLANFDRNLFGRIMTPIVAITGFVLSVTLSQAPLILLSPLFSIYLPAIVTILAIAGLASATQYALKHQETQHDDRHKLHVERLTFVNSKQVGLFLKEDVNPHQEKLRALQKVLSKYAAQTSAVATAQFFSHDPHINEKITALQKLIRFYQGERLAFSEAEQSLLNNTEILSAFANIGLSKEVLLKDLAKSIHSALSVQRR